MFNNALFWYGYFTVGYLVGKPLLHHLQEEKVMVKTIISLLLIFVTSFLWIDILKFSDYRNIVMYVREFSFTFLWLSCCSFLNGVEQFRYIRFIGENSLAVLCTHLFVLIPILRIFHKIFGEGHPLLGGIQSILAVIILIPIIKYLNKRFPVLVGK
jgi:hypothetical protein